MKKLLFITSIILSLNCFGQEPKLDTVPNQSVTLRIKDIAWFMDKKPVSNDSLQNALQRRLLKIIEDTVRVYGRNLAQNKTHNITNLPASFVVTMYAIFSYTPFGEVLQMGTTTAERTFIRTQLMGIQNNTIQYYYVAVDNRWRDEYVSSLMRTWWRTAEN